MQVLTKTEVNTRIEYYKRKLRESIFIYPTDTIYGIGCDASNGVLIQKIRDLKGREKAPFSIIAPSKEWIREHCIITTKAEHWIKKLPGPYTLILKIKNPEDFPHTLTQGRETIGVRIPKHWISSCVEQMGIPIITTSANKKGEKHMEDIDDIDLSWRKEVEYAIYEGNRTGTPSKLIYLDTQEIKIQER